MGALGALGGIVKDGSLCQKKISGSNLSQRKISVQYSRWCLMKGPNDIWLILSGYLSRRGYYKQFKLFNSIMSKPEISQSMASFKPAI